MARGTNQGTKRKAMSYTKFGYLFVAPFVIVYCIFSLYPLLTTFWYSGANLQSITSRFWGFSDKEVYYDRYLDLTTYIDDSEFETLVGCKKQDYMKVRNFFEAQTCATQYEPLNANGINAILSNDEISQTAKDELRAALNANDFSLVSADTINELSSWKSSFNDLTLTITNQISSIAPKLDAIVNPASSGDDEEGGETETITAEDIRDSEEYAEFVASLSEAELSDGQVLLVNYLTEISGADSLTAYFENATAENLSDPTFYFICSNLNAPKAQDAEGSSISGIKVPFIADLETFLATSVWADSINGLTTYSNFQGYVDGSVNLHNNENAFYEDLETLYNFGLINNNVLLVADGDTLKPAEDPATNILYATNSFIETNYESDANKVKSAMQISKISSYAGNVGRTILIAQGIEVDKYVCFTDTIDITKYNAFKSEIGLSDVLTMAKYESIENAIKSKRVAAAQAEIEELNAKLPGAQADYDAAVASGDSDAIKKAQQALAEVTTKLNRDQQTVKNPAGILAKVNAKSEYIFIGLQNFTDIFASKTRINTIAGAFVTTGIMWVIGFIPQILLALLLSAWFTDTKIKLKGLGLMKGLMYLPNVITAVTIAILFRRAFSYSSGGAQSIAQQVLHAFGDKDGYNFFESAWATRMIVCFINFWMWYGNTMIVLIAGITSISESLYESAQIDGANSFQTYTKITLPLLRPIVLYTLVTSLIGGLQMYDIPMYINQAPALINFNGSMIRSTRTVLMYINAQAFGKQDVKQVGLAAAVSVILFIVTTILSVLIFYMMRDKDAAKAAKAKKLARKAGATK